MDLLQKNVVEQVKFFKWIKIEGEAILYFGLDVWSNFKFKGGGGNIENVDNDDSSDMMKNMQIQVISQRNVVTNKLQMKYLGIFRNMAKQVKQRKEEKFLSTSQV